MQPATRAGATFLAAMANGKFHWKDELSGGWVDGWIEWWMGGWMG